VRASEPMVRLERFEKRYGKVQAVWPLDLQIPRGESFALLGPNGGGKTTVLRALVGLHAPSGGRVFVNGVDVARSPDEARARLSFVPQRVSLPGMLTARETLTLFARLGNAPLDRVGEVLEEFGLEDSADRRVAEFSGGMVQRLGLALAFIREVDLLVLDEPTLNLDPPGVLSLNRLLHTLKARGMTIVFASHQLRNAMELADRVGILVAGRMVEPEEVPAFHEAVTRRTRVRVVLSHLTEAMIEAVRGAGGDVSGHNGREVSFTALPGKRLEVIRAIEQAGGAIEEFHTDAPDWDALIQERIGGQESPS
jgi:ABC-2 type transport system ATP-binding protein